MMPSVQRLLECLPSYCDEWVTVKDSQSVYDIIEEIIKAHKEFAPYYDQIALYFDADNTADVCKNIYNFLKLNIKYKEEKEDEQTTALPAGLLTRGYGDCKHYSSFAGGILDALNRINGTSRDWDYTFASYDPFNSSPHHVFVSVWDEERNQSIWIDPTPGAKNQIPVWLLNKKVKVKPMALKRNIAGFDIGAVQAIEYVDEMPMDETQVLAPEVVQQFEEVQAETEPTAELQSAIEVLLHYGVMNEQGEISDSQLHKLSAVLPQEEFDLVSHARQVLQLAIADAVKLSTDGGETFDAAIGSVWSDVWRGVKKVSLAAPRNAFLSLVALNVFGYATKLYNAVYQSDGSYWQPGQDKLYKLWNKLGGDWHSLNKAIHSGHRHKAILGCIGCEETATIGVAAAAVPAWVATAAAIIAAVIPLVHEILQNRAAASQMNPEIDPATGLPIGMNMPGAASAGGSITDLISEHPIEAAAAGIGLYLLLI
jgi:hypothetical protein